MTRETSIAGRMRPFARGTMAIALVLGGLAGTACDDMDGDGDIAIFEQQGRCNVQMSTRQAGGMSFTLFVPSGGTGCTGPFPVVGWGNGSLTNTGSYTAFLTNVASHGLTVVSANTSNANGAAIFGGDGTTKVDDAIALGLSLPNVGTRACAMGYSQGGAGAVRAARMDDRVVCTVGIAAEIFFTGPANAQGLARTVFLGGSADIVAPVGTNSQVLFNQAGAPKVLAVIAGADHFQPLGDAGNYRGPAIAALVLNLRPNDPDAAAAGRLINNDALANDPRISAFTRQGTF